MNTQPQPNWFSTTIWLLLIALTLVTFTIGESGHGHIGWRALILAYFVIVGGLIALAYQLA